MQKMESIRSKYEERCRELNVDKDTEENAWKQFVEVKQNFELDDEIEQWICCALYASCRDSLTPTVGNTLVEGNCVSLTKLLRCCNTSIYEFLTKIKKWIDMASLSENFKKQIDILERNFSFTYVLCQRYTVIFQDVFLTKSVDKKSMKFRSKLCDFTWCLFLCTKNECDNQLNLEELFNLLVCCIDTIHKNVLFEKRYDLINPKFKAVPEQSPSRGISSIREKLSAVYYAGVRDANLFKNTKGNNKLMQLFDSNGLFGNRETLLELISNRNFERNWKSLNAAYEHFILDMGTLDERILLNNQSLQNAATIGETSDSIFENNNYLKNNTPLPDMNTLPDKVKKLLEVFSKPHPIGVLCNVSESTRQKLNHKLQSMSNELIVNLHEKLNGKFVVWLVRRLYFHLLEKIVRVEVFNRPRINIDTFLDNDAFIITLFACCAEIVLDSYNTGFEFPWILNCFKMDGFEFSRIIELVVARNQNALKYPHIKHLNYVEKRCLESLAWCSTSKIWQTIDKNGPTFPTWLDVDRNSLSNRDTNLNLRTPTPVANSAFSIFLRKFYKLAWFRLNELCLELNMQNDAYINKIWTLFEHSITHCTQLLRDHHLDQLIMCAIYIFVKVTEIETTLLTDITDAYGKLPLSVSTTYQNVLIKLADDTCIPEYKHLKEFYNKIYMPAMKTYPLYFSTKSALHSQLLISPHPNERSSFPQRIVCDQRIFLTPMEKDHIRYTPKPLVYEFGKSPAKELQNMNDTVRRGKRKLIFGDDFQENDSPNSKYTPKHLKSLAIVVKDRKERSY